MVIRDIAESDRERDHWIMAKTLAGCDVRDCRARRRRDDVRVRVHAHGNGCDHEYGYGHDYVIEKPQKLFQRLFRAF